MATPHPPKKKTSSAAKDNRSTASHQGGSRRRVAWVAGGLLLALAGLMAYAWPHINSGGGGTKTNPINLLLITLDTTRADFLGCYGKRPSPSPHLDQLANEGAKFDQCMTCVSVTLPSHASILTGLYPFVHTIRENGRNSLPASIDTFAEILSRKKYQTAAVTGAMVLNHQFGLNQGFDTYVDFTQSVKLSNQAERRADEVTRLAIEQLKKMANGAFFLWAHYYDPHDPYLSDRPTAPAKERYADEIAYMDREIGRLLDALKQSGLDEHTLVVVVGDHGEGLGDHDEANHGHFVYQTTLHVPLIMRLPGKISPGTVVKPGVRTIDLGPTIVDLVGAPSMEGAQGRSLMTLMTGSTNQAPPVYAESMESYLQFGHSPLRVLITDQTKYVHAPKPELFNLASDPGEVQNMISNQPEQASRMREMLLDLITDSPPPPKDRGTVALSTKDRQALESLGYVAPSGNDNLAGTSELDLFEPAGVDPREHKSILQDYADAQSYVNSGRFSEAIPLLDRVIAAAPKSGRVLAGKALCFHRLGQVHEADQTYQQAIQLEPENIQLQKMYVGLLIATKRWSEAEKQLKAILPRAPEDAELWYNMGVVLTSQDRPVEAEPHFLRAIELAPGEARYIYGLGQHFLRQNNLEMARTQFEKALTIDPKHVPSLRELEKLRK